MLLLRYMCYYVIVSVYAYMLPFEMWFDLEVLMSLIFANGGSVWIMVIGLNWLVLPVWDIFSSYDMIAMLSFGCVGDYIGIVVWYDPILYGFSVLFVFVVYWFDCAEWWFTIAIGRLFGCMIAGSLDWWVIGGLHHLDRCHIDCIWFLAAARQLFLVWFLLVWLTTASCCFAPYIDNVKVEVNWCACLGC